MPTVLRVGAVRFFFYAGDAAEPPHIHVSQDGDVAKFWLDPVRVARPGRFARAALRNLERLVTDNSDGLLEAWRDYFGR